MKNLVKKNYLLVILFFSVSVMSSFPVSAQSARIYDITSYGGIGDGRTLNTKAIQQAINACSAKGGGTVHYPAGDYVTGTIYMKDNITLNYRAIRKPDNIEVFNGTTLMVSFYYKTIKKNK